MYVIKKIFIISFAFVLNMIFISFVGTCYADFKNRPGSLSCPGQYCSVSNINGY